MRCTASVVSLCKIVQYLMIYTQNAKVICGVSCGVSCGALCGALGGALGGVFGGAFGGVLCGAQHL